MPLGLQHLLYWNNKQSISNNWHPIPGDNPTKYVDNLPAPLKRTDLQATVVDVAPFIAGAGGLAHISQMHDFGFTAHASIFRNVKTLTVMHRTGIFLTPLVLAFQAMEFEYRNFIPRWAHERELRRDEEEVRKHVDVGMGIGSMIWVARMFFKLGARYWAPIDIIAGGALADLMQREYIKAHGL